MPSVNPFTEEGRTRWRNFHRRLLGYLGLWLALGLASAILFFLFHTRRNQAPLEWLYFRQYAIGSLKAAVFRNSATNYVLLVENVTDRKTGAALTIGVTDDLAHPLRDSEGHAVRNQE